MDKENNSTKFKVLIGVLTALLIALGVYTVSLYNDSKNTVTGLENQKAEIEQELQELIANYDEIIKDNELKDKDLLAARERIEVLLDSVKTAEANVALIKRYKAEIGRLKDERKMLFARADSLIQANQMLAVEIDSAKNIINETIRVVDSVSMENVAMTETIKKGSVVKAVDLRGEAVILRGSGKIVDTRRASRADKIRACFTLTPNIVAQKGDRLLYVQVINPKNNLLGDKSAMKFENGTLNYSATTKVYYEQEELDVCVLVDALEEELIAGRYVINVFDGSQQVASSTMELK
jgi:cell division protein FtsB